ncbi:hypothetical protein I4641_22975, partial [Waterburya agarophytonicola K14]|nr:hypothetical protein [Waterburya agarophytonicola KI4]
SLNEVVASSNIYGAVNGVRTYALTEKFKSAVLVLGIYNFGFFTFRRSPPFKRCLK